MRIGYFLGTVLVLAVVLNSAPVVANGPPACASTVERVFATQPRYLDKISAGQGFVVTADMFGLSIWDTADPEAIEHVGAWTRWGSAHRGWIFEADERGFLYSGANQIDIFDVRGPQTPHPIAGLDANGNTMDVDGNLLAAVGSRLFLADVSDPANPEIVCDNCFDFNGSNAYDPKIALVGSYLYATRYNNLYVVDLANPSEPIVAAMVKYETGLGVREAQPVVGDDLVLINGYFKTPVDITDPYNPVVHEPFDGYLGSYIFLIGRVVYGYRNGMLLRTDFSDPANPVELQPIDLGSLEIFAMSVFENRLYFVHHDQIHVLDIDDDFREIGTSGDPGRIVDFAVDDNLAIVSNSTRGLDVYSVEASRPEIVGHVSFDEYSTWNVEMSGTTAFVNTDRSIEDETISVIQVVDLSDLTDPRVVNTLGDSGFDRFGWMTADSGLLVISGRLDSDYGIEIYDISLPDEPEKLCNIAVEGWVKHLVVHDRLLFVGHGSWISVIDLKDPGLAEILSSILYNSETFTVVDNLIIVPTEGKVNLIDVSDPRNPIDLGTVAGNLNFGGYFDNVVVSDGTTVAMVDHELFLGDFSNPSEPILRRLYPRRIATDLEINNGFLYVLAAPYFEKVRLECGPPKADFSWTQAGLAVYFSRPMDYSVGADPQIDDAPDITWSYGDGATRNWRSAPDHIYAAPGTYMVTLEVGNTFGRDRLSHVISVREHKEPVSPVRRGGGRTP